MIRVRVVRNRDDFTSELWVVELRSEIRQEAAIVLIEYSRYVRPTKRHKWKHGPRYESRLLNNNPTRMGLGDLWISRKDVPIPDDVHDEIRTQIFAAVDELEVC